MAVLELLRSDQAVCTFGGQGFSPPHGPLEESAALMRTSAHGRQDSPPHGARVVVVGEDQLHAGVALVRLQVRARGRDGPVQVACEAVLLHHLARAELRACTRRQ